MWNFLILGFEPLISLNFSIFLFLVFKFLSEISQKCQLHSNVGVKLGNTIFIPREPSLREKDKIKKKKCMWPKIG